METITLQKDVKVLCVRAVSFPLGIQNAFDKLMNTLPDSENRRFYGISTLDEEGKVIYKAAAEQLSEGEAKKYGFETFLIDKGDYLAVPIEDWKDNLTGIGPTLMEMWKDPRADQTYPCVEWYKNEKEMLCMVRIKASAKVSN